MEAISTASALALIARLPRAEAEIVALRIIAGLDVAQVAGILRKRPRAVRALGERGLRHLAELVSVRAEDIEAVRP